MCIHQISCIDRLKLRIIERHLHPIQHQHEELIQKLEYQGEKLFSFDLIYEQLSYKYLFYQTEYKYSIFLKNHIKSYKICYLKLQKQMIHGTKKQKKVKTQQQLKQQQQISNKINAKLSDFFLIRNSLHNDDQVNKYLQFTALLMQLCSDIPTIFNFRRQLLERVIKINYQSIQKIAELLINQIKLITKLIRQDPKSYTLWSYRQWLVQKIYKNNKAIVIQQKQLCKMLLMKDQKNFHVWNYRNWVNSIQMNVDEQLHFTSQKIKSNPFNFSPYHFRSKYLPLKYQAYLTDNSKETIIKKEIIRFGMPKQIFDSQLQNIKTAIFLNPHEQAPWIYYRWILKRILPVIVLSRLNQENKHTIVLNQRTKDLDKFIQFVSPSKKLTSLRQSNVWQFQSNSNPIFVHSQSNIIESQEMSKQLIIDRKINLDDIRQIYNVQRTFINQILSQQPNCRFAWLQLLEISKNLLYLTCSSEQWTLIVKEANDGFKKLDQQQKTRQYIQKLKNYWTRIQIYQNLENQEKYLINNK